MKVACVLHPEEVKEHCDAVVFPEGVRQAHLYETSAAWPAALIVGAFQDRGYCRGVIVRQGQILTTYLKVRSDGRTRGSENVHQMPVFDDDRVCLGLLVCMDIDHLLFSAAVRARVRTSKAATRLLCIPADMGSQWLNWDQLPYHHYDGMHVALCNNTATHEARCKSFVADTEGRKVKVQREVEPLIWNLALSS